MRISFLVAVSLPVVLLLAPSASAESTAGVPAPPAAAVAPPVPSAFVLPAPTVMKRNSTGMFVTGIVFIPVGLLAATAGGLTLVISAASESSIAVPTTLVGVGGGMIVSGIVMAVVGGKKVPAESATVLGLSPRQPKASLEPLFGPTSAGIRVHF